MPAGIDAEAKELEDMKGRRTKLERTTTVLNKHDLVVQKLIMKAREDLVRYDGNLNYSGCNTALIFYNGTLKLLWLLFQMG